MLTRPGLGCGATAQGAGGGGGGKACGWLACTLAGRVATTSMTINGTVPCAKLVEALIMYPMHLEASRLPASQPACQPAYLPASRPD